MPDWSKEIRERLAGLARRSGARGIDRRGDRASISTTATPSSSPGSLARGGADRALDELGQPRARRGARRSASPPRAFAGSARRRWSRRLAVRPRPGFPIRRPAPAPRAALLPGRDPVARARHRRQHGDLPASRRRPAAHAADRSAGRAVQRAHRAGRQPVRQFLGRTGRSSRPRSGSASEASSVPSPSWPSGAPTASTSPRAARLASRTLCG